MAVSAPPVRTVAGRTVPQPGTWEFDRDHTEVGFEGRHLMVSRVRGRFTRFAGRLRVAEVPEESSAELVVETASIDSDFKDRDDHLRSSDWFDVERHPTMSFRSTSIAHVEGDRWRAAGELTIKGITRPVELDVEFGGGVEAFGLAKIGFTATAEVDREVWDLRWNALLEAGGLAASRTVRLTINVEAVLQE